MARWEVLRWLVRPGDRVCAGAGLVVVAVDGIEATITAPQSGRVAAIDEATGRIAQRLAELASAGPEFVNLDLLRVDE